MKLCLLLFTFMCAILRCSALPDGAPKSACISLTPSHSGIPAQTSTPPYTVSTVKSGTKIRVTISSPIGEELEGFILQARSANDRSKFIDGEFTGSEVSKATDCFKGKKNTLTHKSPTAKKEVVTEWTPRSAANEDVVFRATVAKTYDIFWTEIDSSPVNVVGHGAMSEAETDSNNPSIYDSCFVSASCFGLPSSCVLAGDCEVLLTYAKAPDGIRFSLHGILDSSMYMAMALSNDNLMGEDSVTECIRDGSSVIARESWNEGRSNTRTRELPKERYDGSFTNGLTSCSWTTPYLTEKNGQNYDLLNNKYYILLAKGEVTNGRLKYHSEKLASSEPANFTAFESIEGEGVSDSVKVHGLDDENTESQYTPTVSYTTDEHEAKSTGHREAKSTSSSKIAGTNETVDSNCSSQLSFSLFLLVIFGLFFATERNLLEGLS